jgi:hypothetical protein
MGETTICDDMGRSVGGAGEGHRRADGAQNNTYVRCVIKREISASPLDLPPVV